MKITFIAHSAFLVEWDKFYTLFDYVYEPDYTGTLPPLDPQKPLLVFSSHSHEDHFDGKVFGLLEQYPLTQFFVSRDTRLTERRRKWLGISDEAFARTTVLRPDSILLTEAAGEELSVRAIKSTDIGNAYLLRAEGKMVYHGGDLNWWHWEGEAPGWNRNMEVDFKRYAEPLRGRAIDLAMLPLDPRLGEDGFRGPRYFLELADIRRFLPMHQWGDFALTERFLARHPQWADRVVPITAEGQQFTF